MWVTANGLRHPLSRLSISHVKNIITCLNGYGEMEIPNPYQGKTHDQWREIFDKELKRRYDEVLA